MIENPNVDDAHALQAPGIAEAIGRSVWIEDERWSDRWKLPDWVPEYFAGRLTHEEMKARMGDI